MKRFRKDYSSILVQITLIEEIIGSLSFFQIGMRFAIHSESMEWKIRLIFHLNGFSSRHFFSIGENPKELISSDRIEAILSRIYPD